MSASRSRFLAALTVPGIAILAVLAGYGRGEDGVSTPESQVRTVVERFGAASARKDAVEICDDLITPALVAKVQQFGLSCESAFKRGLNSVVDAQLRVLSVQVTDDTALVQVHSTAFAQPSSDDTLKLVKAKKGWRIASLSGTAGPVAAPAK